MSWLAQQPQVVFTARDGSDTNGYVRFHFRRGVEAEAANAGASQRRGLLESVSGCTFVQQDVRYSRIETTPAAPLVWSRCRRVAVFIFDTDTPGQFALIQIPGLLPELLLTTGDTAELDVDRLHPDIVALVEHLISGAFCNRFGYQLGDLVAAYVQDRPSLYFEEQP